MDHAKRWCGFQRRSRNSGRSMLTAIEDDIGGCSNLLKIICVGVEKEDWRWSTIAEMCTRAGRQQILRNVNTCIYFNGSGSSFSN